MNHLVHGEVHGLTWYEIPRAAGGWSARDLDPRFGVITVVAPPGRFPSDHVAAMLRSNPAATSIATAHFPFRPFDAGKEMPDRAVMYAHHDFTDADIDAWAKANVEIPEGVDLTFSMSTTRHAVYASAATVRKGRLVHVRRRLDVEKVFTDALAEHMPYFVRNCPRPAGDLAEFTCGAHVAAILQALPNRSAVSLVETWLERHRQAPEQGVPALSIIPEFVPGTGVVSMSLDMFPGTNAVKASITVAGGHRIEDDPTGIEVSLRAKLPDSVAASLKGRMLTDAIDIPWADGISIRLVRDRRQGADDVSMKAAIDSVPLVLPSRAVPDDAAARAEIEALTNGDHPRWQKVEATALPVLAGLGVADLAEVMSRMIVEHRVDLDRYGLPGWALRGRGAEIIVEECPSHEAADLLAMLYGKPGA